MALVDFAATQTLPVNLSGENNPGDLHLPVGRWDPGTGLSWVTRSLVKAPLNFAGMTGIVSAQLYLYHHTAAGWHANGSGSPTLAVYRKTADWGEASGGQGTGTDELWGGSGAALVTGGYTADGAAVVGVNADAADGALSAIDITQIVQAWHAGQPNYGLMLFAANESAASAAFEFYSRRSSGKVPFIRIDYSTSAPPLAPWGLSPSGLSNTNGSINYSWQHNDANGSPHVESHWQRWNSGQTELYSEAYLPYASYGESGVQGDFYWRVRTKNAFGLWGPWSDFVFVTANWQPYAPVITAVPTNTLTPTISGTASDPNSFSAITHVELVVNIANGGEVLHTTIAAGTSWSHVYNGSPLQYGQLYLAYARARDVYGAWGPWSPYYYFTPQEPVGPTLSPNSTATKQNTLTPNLTVSHASAFTDHEIEVNTPNGPIVFSDAPSAYAATTSKIVAASGLAWGGTYHWRARVLIGGVWSVWSPYSAFYVNALPTATAVAVEHDNGSPSYPGSTGVDVVTDSTPVLRAPFSDPDKAPYSDTASARRIEIRRQDTQAALSGYPNTTGTTDTHTITTALTENVTYEARVGFRDAAGQPSGSYVYSPWKAFRYSRGPSAALTAPANASTVTDSTPELDWSFTSPTGKTQKTYRVRIYDKGPTGANYADEVLRHDSGVTTSDATSYSPPLGVIENGHDYRWQVDVTDTDNIPYVLA